MFCDFERDLPARTPNEHSKVGQMSDHLFDPSVGPFDDPGSRQTPRVRDA